MAEIAAICVSEKRGVQKDMVIDALLIRDHGIEGDADAGSGPRQVSMLSEEKIAAAREDNPEIRNGLSGENLVIRGLDVASLPVGTLLWCGDALLEITQIGSDCKKRGVSADASGDCVFRQDGVFARVLHGAEIRIGSSVSVGSIPDTAPFRAAVITVTDYPEAETRQGRSGAYIFGRLRDAGYVMTSQFLLPRDDELLYKALCRLADQHSADLILTAGGIGFSPRDTTPEATIRAAHRDAPGISEAIRAYLMTISRRAMLTRGRSVIRHQTLIVNLPGDPKSCAESLDCLLPVLPSGLAVLRGDTPDREKQGTGRRANPVP